MNDKKKKEIMKKLGIKLSMEDQLRKELLEVITRSYEDTHALSYLLVSIKHLANKY